MDQSGLGEYFHYGLKTIILRSVQMHVIGYWLHGYEKAHKMEKKNSVKCVIIFHECIQKQAMIDQKIKI